MNIDRDLTVRTLLLSLTFALVAAPALVSGADLDDYVKKPDDAFRWKLLESQSTPLGKIISLEFTSQVWQGITWNHRLTIYEPIEPVYRDTALLLITGGSTGSKPGPKDHASPFAMARATGARVAVLNQVPNQPLLGDKKEDALIAETFVRYLETKDPNWPLLFPMAKSAVRAMDAVQAWAKAEGQGEIKRFVVTGGSKRGWTTWLTGAVDHRVIAIAPMVIVMLNLGTQGPNQLHVWGKYSEQIEDYVNRGLMERAQTAEGSRLWKMVDPYTFRDRLSIPKLLINGTNDRYWTLDAIDLFWDGLKGEKHVIEVPNAGHGLETNRDWALNGLGAFFRHVATGRPMPRLSWSFENSASGASSLTIHADPPPRSAHLWTTTSESRDFRESKWESSPLTPGTTIASAIAKPARGHSAAFVELQYEIDGIPYRLTTTFVEPGVEPRGPGGGKP